MEPESPIRPLSSVDSSVTSPKSKSVSSDTTLRGSENITPQGKFDLFAVDLEHNM